MRLTQLLEQLEILFENRKIELIVKKQSKKIYKAYERDRTSDLRLLDSIFDGIEVPTSIAERKDHEIESVTAILEFFQTKIHKKYVQWLANRYMNKEFQLEDWKQIKDDLKTFDKVKAKLRIKDINQYESMVALDKVIDALKDTDNRSNKQKEKDARAKIFKDKDAVLFYKDSDIKIEIPKTEEAACILGKGTRWCTSARDNNMFSYYNRDGDLYIITTKSGEKYQFHLHTKQFMDSSDRDVPMIELLEEYPSILKAIPDLEYELSMFTRAEILGMGYSEVNDMLLTWLKSSTSYDIINDNTVVIESFNRLDDVFRNYDFMDLSYMLAFIDDPSSIPVEIGIDGDFDPFGYFNNDIKDMLSTSLKNSTQYEMFDLSDYENMMNSIRKEPELYSELMTAVRESVSDAIAEKMSDYLEEAVDDDLTSFLFDTEYSGGNAFIMVIDKALNFQDSSYGMVMEMYTLNTALTDTGWDDISDREFEGELDTFFGEEFSHNDDLLSIDDFKHTIDHADLASRIKRILN